jgi:formylglycine-generating enzyme required for sulfatase activity
VSSAERTRATSPAISGRINGWGLYHVLGNVGDWAEDCWNESLAGMPPDGTARTTGECARRVVRGGSWIDDANVVRSALRASRSATGRNNLIGIRVVREME